MATVRLHKAIADAGIASRRAAEEMIRQGKVSVNGEVVTAMGVMVDPRTDKIAVDGTPLGQAGRKRTYIFYKPPGFICTRDDPHGRSTVFDIIPDEVGMGLHTAGRLDMDAEGLLILTNDGELTLTLTHPSSHLPKTYVVKVKGEVQLRALKKLRRGVELDDGVTLPASVSVIKGTGTDRNTWLRMILREGKKNQIKRMCDAVGHRVLSIKRTSIGGMTVPEKMKPGSFKKLSKKEIETLIGGRERTVQSPKSKDQRERPGEKSRRGDTGTRQRGERTVQSPSTFAKASPFAKATGDKSADRKPKSQREIPESTPRSVRTKQVGKTGPRSKGGEGEETRSRKGWAAKSPKAKSQRAKPGERGRPGDAETRGRRDAKTSEEKARRSDQPPSHRSRDHGSTSTKTPRHGKRTPKS